MKAVYLYVDTTTLSINGEPLLLPLAVADKATELAQIVGDSNVNILSAIWHADKRKKDEAAGKRKYKGTTTAKYEKVYIEEDEEEWQAEDLKA